MTLSALIRKRESGKIATAISAIPATQSGEEVETVARIATVAVANPTEAKPAPMTAEEETAIRAWLEHIEETDPATIAEVLRQCQRDADARDYFLKRAEEVPTPPEPDYWATCGACRHFRRIEHPNLGHCTRGEPEAVAGLWDADRRYCLQYQAVQEGGE